VSDSYLCRWFMGAVLGLVLYGCIVPFAGTPASGQAETPQSVGVLQTLIVQTAAAAQTQTVAFLPTSTNTSIPSATLFPTRTPLTPTLTPTYIYAFPTFTRTTPTHTPQLIPIASKDTAADVGDATVTRLPKIPKEWNCTITGKAPPMGTSVDRKAKFSVSWTIKNTGTKIWTSNTIDFVYTGGFRSDERPIQDLRSTVAPGGSITVKVQLAASKFPGTYNIFWSLKVGKTKFCHMKYTFEVR
jgi:hypothetical protein